MRAEQSLAEVRKVGNHIRLLEYPAVEKSATEQVVLEQVLPGRGLTADHGVEHDTKGTDPLLIKAELAAVTYREFFRSIQARDLYFVEEVLCVDAFLISELLFFTLGWIAVLEKRQKVVVLHNCIVFITLTVDDGSLSILEHL